jgi:hypothetical protein
MKRAVVSTLTLALGAVLLGAAGKPTFGYAGPVPVRHSGTAGGTIARALAFVAPVITPHVGEIADRARRRLHQDAAGTYIQDILRERDSALIRWPDRRGIPLAVWIQPSARIKGFLPEFVGRVRDAFVEWDDVHLPVRFTFVRDSINADVHVNWVDHFAEQISGRTRWSHDEGFAITDANIVLAVHHSNGGPLDEDAVGAIALHEVGHLLGLDHTTDSLAIMAPRVRVRRLAEADRATARLLYALPARSFR